MVAVLEGIASESEGTGHPTEGQEGPKPPLADAGSSGAGAQVSASVPVDVVVLASILNQACGPILDRLSGQLPWFTDDGPVEVSTWITDYERFCSLERVTRVELLLYIRLYSCMMVGEASNWKVVKTALVAKYDMP